MRNHEERSGNPVDARSISSRMSKRRGGGTKIPSGITSTLRRGELVGAVRGADRNRKTVDARALHEVFDLVRLGVGALLGNHVVFDTGEHAELTLDRDVVAHARTRRPAW